MDSASLCSHCGTNNPAGRFFCVTCSRPLTSAVRPSAPVKPPASTPTGWPGVPPPRFLPGNTAPYPPGGGRGTRVATGLVTAVNDVGDRGAEAARQFLQSLGVNYTAARDETGIVTRAYQIPSLPTTFFVDRAGVIKEKQIGAASAAALQRKIQAIL